jgi:hypothetical protein
MRPSWIPLLLSLGCTAATIATVAGLRSPFEPNAGEVLAGDFAVVRRWASGPIAAIAAASLVMLWLRFSARGVRAGSFGAFVAVTLTGTLPLLALPLALPEWTSHAFAAAGAVVAVALAPSLRERGLVSLALLGVVLALPAIVALRAAHTSARLASPLAAVAKSVGSAKVPVVGVVFADEVAEHDARALPLRLRAPWADGEVAILAVRANSAAAPLLRRLDLPLLQLRGDTCLPLPALTGRLERRYDIEAAFVRTMDGALQSLSVRWTGSGLGAHAIVITPCGAIEATFDDQHRAVFDEAASVQLRGWLRPLPSGTSIRVLVVPPDPADAACWTVLQT